MTINRSPAPHIPVMLPEVLAALKPANGEVYVDGTFGAGGYSRAILDAADCTVIAIDRDGSALGRAAEMTAIYGSRFVFVTGCFGDVAQHLQNLNMTRVNGFVLDLGVSSMQIDTPERGFSFRFDGPLDMRMSPSEGRSAADIVNTETESGLADIIYRYGEERHSRRIARAIIRRRSEKKFQTTLDLAQVIKSAMPKTKSGKDTIDPATRSFQALRIAVNDELGELERALAASPDILESGGRLVAVSFHSLEDRIIKEYLLSQSTAKPRGSRHMPEQVIHAPLFSIPVRKALQATDAEAATNPRSRSAKLRHAIRLPRGAA